MDEELPEPPSEYSLQGPQEQLKTSIGFTGKGQAAYTNGDTYDGIYENGVRNGAGKYFYRANRSTFEGTFESNKKVGMGRINYKDGGFYHGYFQDGKRHGEGTFQYQNKDIYSGMWKDGKRHGKGTYVYSDTKYELKGTWKEGQIVQGTWTFTDGTRYIGGFQNSKPCGDGVWETNKDTIVEGAYVQQVVPLSDDDAGKKQDGAVSLKQGMEKVWSIHRSLSSIRDLLAKDGALSRAAARETTTKAQATTTTTTTTTLNPEELNVQLRRRKSIVDTQGLSFESTPTKCTADAHL